MSKTLPVSLEMIMTSRRKQDSVADSFEDNNHVDTVRRAALEKVEQYESSAQLIKTARWPTRGGMWKASLPARSRQLLTCRSPDVMRHSNPIVAKLIPVVRTDECTA